jgi:hypothetical protein
MEFNPPIPIISQINLVHIILSYTSKINFISSTKDKSLQL